MYIKMCMHVLYQYQCSSPLISRLLPLPLPLALPLPLSLLLLACAVYPDRALLTATVCAVCMHTRVCVCAH